MWSMHVQAGFFLKFHTMFFFFFYYHTQVWRVVAWTAIVWWSMHQHWRSVIVNPPTRRFAYCCAWFMLVELLSLLSIAARSPSGTISNLFRISKQSAGTMYSRTQRRIWQETFVPSCDCNGSLIKVLSLPDQHVQSISRPTHTPCLRPAVAQKWLKIY